MNGYGRLAFVAALLMPCAWSPSLSTGGSRAASSSHAAAKAVQLELTVRQPGGEVHKPQLTVDVGETGIASFDGIGRIGLHPTSISERKVVTLTLLDASVTPMKELETVRVGLNASPVAAKSRPNLSIGLLRVYDVK